MKGGEETCLNNMIKVRKGESVSSPSQSVA